MTTERPRIYWEWRRGVPSATLALREVDHVTTEPLGLPMADEKPKTLSVKLHIDVIEAARIVSAYRNETITDMLSDILRPVLVEMERDEVAKRSGAKTPKSKGAK